MTADEALVRMRRYCDFQERCHQEVRRKLIQLKVFGDDLEWVIGSLIEEDLLNEERFARSFARGRFRLKSWGRHRILRELRRREISEYCQRQALSEIDEQEYLDALDRLIQHRAARQRPEDHPMQRREDLIKYALSRGFESGLIRERVAVYLAEQSGSD